MSPYSFCILLIKIKSSWLIFEWIKALEIETSIIFNLDFACNTILLCLFFFFLIIDLYFFISASIAQIYCRTRESYRNTKKKEEEVDIEIHPVTVEAKLSKCSK